jgi:DNA-binding NtrC family response regulator
MQEQAGRAGKIVIIHHDQSFAEFAALILEEAGFRVTTFLHCLDIGVNWCQYPDVVVIGIDMSGMSDEALQAWLEHRFPACGVLLVVSEKGGTNRIPFPHGPRYLCVNEPVNPQHLISCVCALIR